MRAAAAIGTKAGNCDPPLRRTGASPCHAPAAREHKRPIAAILHFLSELDALTEAESDRTSFEEFALLFVEITRSADAAVSALRGV